MPLPEHEKVEMQPMYLTEDLLHRISELEAENANLRSDLAQLASRIAFTWHSTLMFVWQHEMNGRVGILQNDIYLLKDLISADGDPAMIQRVLESLSREIANLVGDAPIPMSPIGRVEVVHLNFLINELLQKYQRRAMMSDVSVSMGSTSSSEITVSANPEWLSLCLEMLLHNAVKAMSDTRFKSIKISTSKVNASAEIRVSDTGPGVPGQIRDRLFREAIHESETQKTGQGIGLLIARAIIQGFGGDIELSQTGPTGTTFTITLPIIPST